VRGDQQPGRCKSSPQLCGLQTRCGFKLDITPLTTGTHGLREDRKLSRDVAGKLPSSAAPAASGDQSKPVAQTRKAAQECCALGGAAQVVKAQLKYAGSVPDSRGPELAFVFGSGWRGYHAADAVLPEHGDV